MADKSRQKPTILVADDDIEILALVTRHLRRMDATILEASDGEEALKVARREKPDLVVLDVMMPGMSGWEVCRAIREDASLEGTGVIMLTGIGERLNEMTSPLYGADDHLDKPFDFDELDKRVASVLQKKGHP
ncbi:response regulator transcription factor [Sandaracinus amylolyticus]|uniref:response regulator transcription factor n=1 Tax=Sandaracinus amylolyticus TaxID=927083 RepID=UPI001EFFEB70|nr:response regulator [Sandaracinus amylolyticus]UJR80197.1 Phosphate regulon transcriptional regulatory protein PhoB [Sandaracinus amylolyticus]